MLNNRTASLIFFYCSLENMVAEKWPADLCQQKNYERKEINKYSRKTYKMKIRKKKTFRFDLPIDKI